MVDKNSFVYALKREDGGWGEFQHFDLDKVTEPPVSSCDTDSQKDMISSVFFEEYSKELYDQLVQFFSSDEMVALSKEIQKRLDKFMEGYDACLNLILKIVCYIRTNPKGAKRIHLILHGKFRTRKKNLHKVQKDLDKMRYEI